MPTYLTPGVYFETTDVTRPAISAVRTDIAAFVGIAERGPLDTPARVNSWQQFQSLFGNFIPNGYLAYSVKAFFENGGRSCYIVRVAATPRTETDRAAAQPADGSASIVLSIEGFSPGNFVRVRQGEALSADHLLGDVDEVNRRLTWERQLEPEFILNDPALPLRFETGALTASGLLIDGAGRPTVRVEALSPGAWGNALTIRLGRSTLAQTRTRSAPPQPSSRTSSFVETVAGFPAGTLVQIFQDHTPAPLRSYRSVKAVDAVLNRLTWDVPLDPALDLNKTISFESLEFALTVYLNGQAREHFSGLSLIKVASAPPDDYECPKRAYVEEVINGPQVQDEERRERCAGSQLIRVTDLHSPSAFPDRLPALGAPNLSNGLLRLQSGQDGVSALRPEDFTGDVTIGEPRGLRSLESVDQVSIVAVPDILIQPAPAVQTAPLPPQEPPPCLPFDAPPTIAEPPVPRVFEQPPAFTLEDVSFVQSALVAHCESLRDRFALLDPPVITQQWIVSNNPLVLAGNSTVMETNDILNWRERYDSQYAALYYPWVLVYDPLRLGNQIVRAIPPSGHVAGIYARTDIETGVHKAPANEELYWAQGVTNEVMPEAQGLLNPVGINAIRTFPGRGIRLFGARTLSSDSLWRFVNIRRLMMMIEESVEDSIQWSVFEPNDFHLRETLVLSITSFLESLRRRGAFTGATADEAYFVKCDDVNNPPDLSDLGEIVADVGVAPVTPAEFVVFRIGRTENGLEITE